MIKPAEGQNCLNLMPFGVRCFVQNEYETIQCRGALILPDGKAKRVAEVR